MVILRRLGLRLLLLAATAGAITTVPTVLSTDTSKPAVQIVGAPPCVNGVVPVNPYIVNCNLPPSGSTDPWPSSRCGSNHCLQRPSRMPQL